MLKTTREKTLSLCITGILAALYVPMSLFLAVQMGNVRISFGSLPVVTAALLLGPAEAAGAAFVGEFIKQLLTYGVTATTVLYLIPPALRGLVIGAAALAVRRLGPRRLEERKVLCYTVCVVAAVCTTLGNTLVNLLDSLIYGYYTPLLVWADLLYRLGVGILNSAVIATVSIPIVMLLRRQFRIDGGIQGETSLLALEEPPEAE